MSKPKALYVLGLAERDQIYAPSEQRAIAGMVDLYAAPQTPESIKRNTALLNECEVILSGWGGPVLDEDFLRAAPPLRGFFYAGGSLADVLTPAVWKRKIAVSSAIAANAIPVAQYTLATIIFSLKQGWKLSRQTREERKYPDRDGAVGCYGATVGLISLGVIARSLLPLLKPLDLNVIAYDPFLTDAEANELGIEAVPLTDLFKRADVVSLHAPLLPETMGLVTGAHLESMKKGATFINTARGDVVVQEDLIAIAARRDDLQFVLDVASPEPPPPSSLLYALPNVVLTPHIAGSIGNECFRMGRYIVEELRRFLSNEPLEWAVTIDSVWHTSHRPTVSRSPVNGKSQVTTFVRGKTVPRIREANRQMS